MVAEAGVCCSAFNDTNRKLTRYSNTVEKTKSLLLWWEGLTAVDQANVSSIETLVTEVEEIFHQEHAAWLCMSFDFLKKDMKDEANQDNGYFKTTNQKETPLDVSSTSTATILET